MGLKKSIEITPKASGVNIAWTLGDIGESVTFAIDTGRAGIDYPFGVSFVSYTRASPHREDTPYKGAHNCFVLTDVGEASNLAAAFIAEGEKGIWGRLESCYSTWVVENRLFTK